MKLDLRQLRHVLAVDRYRSFARAAEEIGLTQPALSRSIQALESLLGARIFDRDRSRVEPTAVGIRLIDMARPLLMQARLAERELERMVDAEGGLLRIGAGPYAAEISVGTAVGRLASMHAGIRVDVLVGDWPDLYRKLIAGELDVVIAETSHAVDDERLLIEPLPQHQASFFCRPGHPLADVEQLSLQDIANYPLAATYLPRRLLALAGKSEVLATSALPDGVSASEFRVENPYLAREIVAESDVVGVAVPMQIEREINAGRLVTLPLRPDWLKTYYGIVRMARRTPSPAVNEFVRVLKDVELEIESR